MSDLTTTVDTYLATWSEGDATKRASAIERIWTSDARLIDPPLEGEGHAGVNDMAAALQSQFPGHAFRRTSAIDAHHNFVRFAWELVAPDGTVALTGLDVGEIDDDGRLRRITGFFGELPPDDRGCKE
jgi:SnoaL-like domain